MVVKKQSLYHYEGIINTGFYLPDGKSVRGFQEPTRSFRKSVLKGWRFDCFGILDLVGPLGD